MLRREGTFTLLMYCICTVANYRTRRALLNIDFRSRKSTTLIKVHKEIQSIQD
jgi:hypothetical protein